MSEDSTGSSTVLSSTVTEHEEMTGEICQIPKNSDVFTLGELIGSGSFANVYKAVDKETKRTIAIKSFRMRRKDMGHFSRAATEIAFIKFLKHPNIIGYVYANIKKQYMYLGIEYSPYGSMINFMEKSVGLCEKTVQFIMRQLLSALCYLHGMFIFHGDVKPENIIVFDVQENNLVIKLSDFGLAEVILKGHVQHKKSGSFYYMSPEIHLGFPVDYTSDLYSAGIFMYEMLFGQKPFNTKIPKDQYVVMLRRRVDVMLPRFESSFLSAHCIDLVKNLLSYDKQNRLTGEALAKHPFVNIEPVKDDGNHYMKACEAMVRGVDLVNGQEFGKGYIEVIEAILHLKIHINHIQGDEGLFQYMMGKYKDYIVYSDRIEERLVSDRSFEPISMHTQSEKLRCLLKSTPALVAAYDMCSVGEMYYKQCNRQQGATMIKQGLDILFPLLAKEPDGQRKHLLTIKIDQWVKILETVLEAMKKEGEKPKN